ncbi:MAG: (2Fe-2S)-binding protein, partial [Planctomycetes bacterium]|nr:(2Fe-2S)-binding protein [Planctomycetota bacterium]
MPQPIELRVNGAVHRLEVEPRRRLLGVLRDELDLTGTKYGCGEGRCGSCTVLVGGEPERACLLSVEEAAGKEITTIEGLAHDGKLHPVQQAFLDAGALQCGYCTPGMVLAVAALLARRPEPARAEVVEALDGHICRCGVHPRVLEAVERAAALLRGG